MDYADLIEKIFSAVRSNAPFFLMIFSGVLFLQRSKVDKSSKYEGGIIADGEFLRELRKKLPDPIEKNNQDGKLRESFNKIINYFDPKNLKAFYTNLQTIQIEKKPFMALKGKDGNYLGGKNVITYSLKGALTHEILHMGSSYWDKETDVYLSGFWQTRGQSSIGKGICEGYTELLASRIDKKKVDAYHSEAKIARMLEFFFDDPKEMESLYMNHDLPGLVDHMAKFMTRHQAIKLIVDVDELSSLSPFPSMSQASTSAQIMIYKLFSKNCKDEKKVAELRKIACKNKIVEFAIKKRELRLLRGSSSKPINVDELRFEEFDSMPPKVEEHNYSPPIPQTNRFELGEDYKRLIQQRMAIGAEQQKKDARNRKIRDLFDGIISVEDYETFANENGFDSSKIAEEILNEANRRKLRESNDKGRSIA